MCKILTMTSTFLLHTIENLGIFPSYRSNIPYIMKFDFICYALYLSRFNASNSGSISLNFVHKLTVHKQDTKSETKKKLYNGNSWDVKVSDVKISI